MSIKIVSCVMCLCFSFISFQAADYKPQSHRRIESFAGLVDVIKEERNRNKGYVKFDEPIIRKGPHLDGNPDQKTNEKK